MGPVLTAWLHATGRNPRCDTSRGECYSSPTPPPSTHIFQENLIISSGCLRGSSLHFSPWHYSSMAPAVGYKIYGKVAWYSTAPRANRRLFCSFLKCVIQNSVLQCDGTVTLLSKYSFVKFRGQGVFKCRSTGTAMWKSDTVFW